MTTSPVSYKGEFPLAEAVCEHHGSRIGRPVANRILGVCHASGRPCRNHTDDPGVDGVFTPGEAGEGRGKDVLYMHSTLVLVRFYTKFGGNRFPRDRAPGHGSRTAVPPRGDGRVRCRPDPWREATP